ncbi:MAG: hypothetical protein AAF351_15850 [Pseudomonadota bacterium]
MKKVISMFAIAGFALTAAQAHAADARVALNDEIESCVAEVGAHADYADADRVRHTVVDITERTVGYKLEIETAVYGSGEIAVREYATSCVVNGGFAPMQFSINQVADAS